MAGWEDGMELRGWQAIGSWGVEHEPSGWASATAASREPPPVSQKTMPGSLPYMRWWRNFGVTRSANTSRA
eukprot:652887-Prorocentrum_minimum.AAC.1